MDSISALSGTTLVQSSQTTTTDSTAEDELEQDKIEFLNILLTQLENQDPLDPMDTTEWTAQLVSYSQLEQQMEMNTALANISSQLAQSSLTSGLSYVGQTVEIDTDMAPVQNDAASWSYTIEGTASDVYLTVTDSSGTVLWEGGGGGSSTEANSFTLDATDLDVSDGTVLYLSVNAQDSDGNSLDTEISSYATVDGVQSDGETTYLTSGGLSYTLIDVLKITA